LCYKILKGNEEETYEKLISKFLLEMGEEGNELKDFIPVIERGILGYNILDIKRYHLLYPLILN